MTTQPPAPKGFRSIRTKLARLVVGSVGLALLLGAVVSLVHETSRYHETRREALLAAAHAFSAASSETVARGDAIGAAKVLRGIARMPQILRAEIRKVDGSILTGVGSAVRLEGDAELDEGRAGTLSSLLESRTVQVSVPVIHGGETVGRLSLIRDASDLFGELAQSLVLLAGAGIACLGLGLALSHRLQAAITGPIERLTVAMAHVERTGEYVPAEGVATNDETGILATGFHRMMREMRRATDEILARENEIVERLARAGEQRDDQTGQHVVRVAAVSRLVAEALGLEKPFVEDLVRASPMHDVGKISIPDRILFKPGRLDVEERAEMERHAERGHEILAGSRSPLVQLAAEIAISHHERWDGTGYPHRLAGEHIPVSGRITAVADVCDALLSDRPYKKAWSLAEVRGHLEKEAGWHFDPACVEALFSRWDDVAAIYAARNEDFAAAA